MIDKTVKLYFLYSLALEKNGDGLPWDCNEIDVIPGWEWIGGGLIGRIGSEVFSEEIFEGPLYNLDDAKQFLINKGFKLKLNQEILKFYVSSEPFQHDKIRSIEFS